MAGGTIREKNGKYQWVGYLKDKNGKKLRPVKTFDTRKEAEEYKALQAKAPKHIANIRNKTDYTVEEFYKIWQKETQWSTEKYFKYTTTNNWRTLFRKHILPFVGNERLQAIDYSRLQEHFRSTNLSRHTYSNILQAMKSMIEFAKNLNEDLIIVDNLHRVKVIAENNSDGTMFNILSEQHYKEILEYMQDHKLYYANLIAFLYETGLRIEEALALSVDDVPKSQAYVRVRHAIKRQNISESDDVDSSAKTRLVISDRLKSEKSKRSVPLGKYARRALDAQKAMLAEKGIKSKLLFPTQKGRPTDARNVLRSFHSTIDILNKGRDEDNIIEKRGLHSLRKMCCKRLKDVYKLEWQQIADFLGHSSPAVTIRYYYSISEDDVVRLSEFLDANDPRLKREKELADFAGADGDAYFEITDREKKLMKEFHDLDF